MRKITVIIIVVLFIVFTGVIIYLYYTVEKPQEENKLNLVNISVLAYEKDDLTKSLTHTNFSIFIDNFYVGNSETSKYGAVYLQAPVNSTLTLINHNIKNQTYYSEKVSTFIDKYENYRVVMYLEKVGNLTIYESKGNDNTNFKFNNTIYSKGKFKDSVVCLDWGLHIIYVNVENLTKISPSFLGFNHTVCYEVGTLNNQNYSYVIKYNTFGQLNKEDKIVNYYYDFDNNYTLRKVFTNHLV